MSLALYIVLDVEEPGFDTFVNGKALAHATDELAPVCKALGLADLYDYVSMDSDEIGDLVGEDVDMPATTWHDAAKGVRYFETLAAHLRAHPDAVEEADSVAEDLDEYIGVLQKAQAIGARWRLCMDL